MQVPQLIRTAINLWVPGSLLRVYTLYNVWNQIVTSNLRFARVRKWLEGAGVRCDDWSSPFFLCFLVWELFLFAAKLKEDEGSRGKDRGVEWSVSSDFSSRSGATWSSHTLHSELLNQVFTRNLL